MTNKRVCVCVCVCVVDLVVAESSETLLEAYERRVAMYKSTSCCDFCLRMVVSSWSDKVKQDMHTLVNDKGIQTTVILYSLCC